MLTNQAYYSDNVVTLTQNPIEYEAPTNKVAQMGTANYALVLRVRATSSVIEIRGITGDTFPLRYVIEWPKKIFQTRDANKLLVGIRQSLDSQGYEDVEVIPDTVVIEVVATGEKDGITYNLISTTRNENTPTYSVIDGEGKTIYYDGDMYEVTELFTTLVTPLTHTIIQEVTITPTNKYYGELIPPTTVKLTEISTTPLSYMVTTETKAGVNESLLSSFNSLDKAQTEYDKKVAFLETLVDTGERAEVVNYQPSQVVYEEGIYAFTNLDENTYIFWVNDERKRTFQLNETFTDMTLTTQNTVDFAKRLIDFTQNPDKYNVDNSPKELTPLAWASYLDLSLHNNPFVEVSFVGDVSTFEGGRVALLNDSDLWGQVKSGGVKLRVKDGYTVTLRLACENAGYLAENISQSSDVKVVRVKGWGNSDTANNSVYAEALIDEETDLSGLRGAGIVEIEMRGSSNLLEIDLDGEHDDKMAFKLTVNGVRLASTHQTIDDEVFLAVVKVIKAPTEILPNPDVPTPLEPPVEPSNDESVSWLGVAMFGGLFLLVTVLLLKRGSKHE